MRRVEVAVMFCLSACLGAAGFQALAFQKPAVAKVDPAQAPAARWRYHSVRLINEFQIDVTANEQAEKGWEVVEVVPVVTGSSSFVNTQYTILFRRSADLKD
jgi:hypothetical protein